MSIERNIFWRNEYPEKNGAHFANVHVLIGYNQGYITDYLDMLSIIQEVSPDACPSNCHCGKVIESIRVKGFSVLTWNGYLVTGEYAGWTQSTNPPGYHWN